MLHITEHLLQRRPAFTSAVSFMDERPSSERRRLYAVRACCAAGCSAGGTALNQVVRLLEVRERLVSLRASSDQTVNDMPVLEPHADLLDELLTLGHRTAPLGKERHTAAIVAAPMHGKEPVDGAILEALGVG